MDSLCCEGPESVGLEWSSEVSCGGAEWFEVWATWPREEAWSEGLRWGWCDGGCDVLLDGGCGWAAGGSGLACRRRLSRCGRSGGGFLFYQHLFLQGGGDGCSWSSSLVLTEAVRSSSLASLPSMFWSIRLRSSSSRNARSSRIFMIDRSSLTLLIFSSSFAPSTSLSLRFSWMHFR